MKSAEPINPVSKFFTLTLATWFGSGYSPFAPGTAGTAAALPFAFLAAAAADTWLGPVGGWNWANLAAGLLLFYPGVVAATRVEQITGRHDPGLVVVDEAVGLFLTMAFLPSAFYFFAGPYVWAFFVFRVLDVWKPGWIGRSQLLPRGWGVMVDDVLAGLLGGALLWAISHFLPEWMAWGDLSHFWNRVLGG